MKIKALKKTIQGNTIFSFELGREELRLIHNLLREQYLHIPKIFETTQVRNRLKNITGQLGAILQEFIK